MFKGFHETEDEPLLENILHWNTKVRCEWKNEKILPVHKTKETCWYIIIESDENKIKLCNRVSKQSTVNENNIPFEYVSYDSVLDKNKTKIEVGKMHGENQLINNKKDF